MSAELRRFLATACRLTGLIVVVGSLCLTPAAAAAPPPNDNFAEATELTGLPAEATGSNVEATREADEPTPGGHSIWFKWTAPRNAGVTAFGYGCSPPFQDSVNSSFPSVYVESPVFGLVGLASNTFHALGGRVYWIAMTSNVGESDPDVCLRLVQGPANDEFGDATLLSGFPVSATYQAESDIGAATSEPGEPDHGGDGSLLPSVWYSWTAPGDGPTMLRLCGDFSAVAVYTGDRIDALTWLATRKSRNRACGGYGENGSGATLTLDPVKGTTYRIAVTAPSTFRLLVGTQLAVLAGRSPKLFYTGLSGQSDNLKLRLTGTADERAWLIEAEGVGAAYGCVADASRAQLRCPIPGRAPVALDVDLGDANDIADVQLPGAPRMGSSFRVSGGDGDDRLASGGTGALNLAGGRGADRIDGGPGYEYVEGGPGADQINPGAGRDDVVGGGGADRILAADRVSEIIRCDDGRDYAQLDGIDLPGHSCERRRLSSPARAVPTSAELSNSDAEDDDHLVLSIACPLDVTEGCVTKIVAAVGAHRTITRRLRLRAGRSGLVETYTFSYRVLSSGVRVTAITRRRGGRTLRYARRLRVSDSRYFGEG